MPPNMPNIPNLSDIAGIEELLNMAGVSSMKDIPNKEIYMKEIMKQYKDYNPSPGYEPYWPQGAWVFEDDDLKKFGSTTRVPLVCGEECNYLFRPIKTLCAKQLQVIHTDGCNPNLFKTCDGYYPDGLYGYRDFKTYCEFLDWQCHASASSHWIFVHMGSCLDQNALFKPLQKHDTIFNRMRQYLSTMESVFANASLPSPHGYTTTASTVT